MSSSLKVLAGEIHSARLREAFGWSDPLDAGTVSTQIVELSKVYELQQSEEQTRYREALHNKLVEIMPQLYTLLSSLLDR
jgi:hypothetical protein